MNSLSESWTIVENCVQELRPLIQQAVATDDAQKYAEAAAQMATKLLILKTACARGRDQSMEIQRLASAAPVAKRQATESAVASAARPSQPTELRKLTVAPALASIKPQATPQATQQPPPTSTHASGQPDVEQKASVAHQSAADQPAQAGARVTAGDPAPDNAEQTRQGTSIDLNEPAMHLLSSEAADAATPST